MKLSVVIPCYNERDTILEVMRRVRNGPVKDVEIIVVDDASTDGTAEVLRQDAGALADRIIRHERNRGKGAALRSGFEAATGELLSNMLTNLNLTDMETGSKMFRREVVQAIVIEENRFGFEPEITAKVAKLGCTVYEVGVSYYGRTYREGKKIDWRDGVQAIYAILKYNLRWPMSRSDWPKVGHFRH
jgi:hypothetical protein